jgi:hypothetical protein
MVDIHISDVVETLERLSISSADTFSDLFTLQVKNNKEMLMIGLEHAIEQDTDEELQMILMLATKASIKGYEYLQSKNIVIVVDKRTIFNAAMYDNL